MSLWSHWWTRDISTLEEKIIKQHDVENKQLKDENEQLRKENKQLRKNNIVKDATIKESVKKTMEIKSPKEDKNMTDYPNWFDRNKFKKILAIIDSNKFNWKNKTDEFKYTDIKDLVNNIINNAISKISATESLNTLNEIKNAEIMKYKKHTLEHKELLNLFNDLLDTILTDKTLMSSNENGNENGNDKTMPSKEDDNETMNQNNNNIINN